MKRALWPAVIVLALLHHDFWFWNDTRLVFGFLPIGLAWHVGFSIAAGILWALASKYAWPEEIEQFANGGNSAPSKGQGNPTP